MRHINRLIPFALFVLLAVGMAACSADDDDNVVPQGGSEARVPLSLSVTDGGYANPPGMETRAKEDGYNTIFTDGDNIGILERTVRDGTSSYRNVSITLTKGEWIAKDGLYYDVKSSYVAYYPYKPEVYDLASYNDYVYNFIPQKDQSTYAAYTASDLMTGVGVVSTLQNGKYQLSITLTHQMGLMVMEMPKILLTGNGSVNYHPEAFDAPDVTWNTPSKPYASGIGTYRYLVHAIFGRSILSGTYTEPAGNKRLFIIDTDVIDGQYKTLRVDPAVRMQAPRAFAVGDYYYSDGTVLPGYAEKIPPGCIGIVAWLGDVRGDNYGLLNARLPGGMHGLVVALQDIENGKVFWANGYTGVTDWLRNSVWTGSITRPNGFTNIETIDGAQGYANCVAIREFNKVYSNQMLIMDMLDIFSQDHPAPGGSSGWYLGSAREISRIYNDYHFGWLEQLSKVGQRLDNSGSWSSTEHNNTYVYCISGYLISGLDKTSKTERRPVRPILAF